MVPLNVICLKNIFVYLKYVISVSVTVPNRTAVARVSPPPQMYTIGNLPSVLRDTVVSEPQEMKNKMTS